MQTSLTDGRSRNSSQYFTISDEDSNSDLFLSPYLEANDPLLSMRTPDGAGDEDGHQSFSGLEGHRRVPSLGQSLRTSSSEVSLAARQRSRKSVSDSAHSVFVLNSDNYSVRKPGTVPPDTSPATQASDYGSVRRSSSSSRLDSNVRYHDPAIASATLQQQLAMQINHTGQPPLRPLKVRRVRTATRPFHWTDPRSPSPGFKWFRVRSTSNPERRPLLQSKLKKNAKDVPLKPCMKQKSKSATTTPPGESPRDNNNLVENQKLRRVKTVDFDEGVSKELLSLPPLQAWSGESMIKTLKRAEDSRPLGRKLSRFLKRAPSFPLPAIKSKLADPAVTRTDVHVVAVAPSWSPDALADEGGIDPATPTMQIVESESGCYEVIWDDVPAEHDVRLRRSSSSASQALHAFSSTAPRALERVNSKLTEWNWRRDGSDQFQPQIVVFPDDEGHLNVSNCAVEDEQEESPVLVPPNSARGSATPSRQASQPPSARMSRSTSFEEDSPSRQLLSPRPDPIKEEEGLFPDRANAAQKPDTSVAALAVPDPDLCHPRSSSQPPRSSTDDPDIHFRGHRDSVALARSRVANAGVSPQLFMHRDSVTLTKKRMHARNHAISEVRPIPPRDDLTPASPSPSTVKAQAATALKNSTASSMLNP